MSAKRHKDPLFLSLLQLKQKAKQSNTVKCLPLGGPQREPKAGSSCLVAGWGVTDTGEASDVLMSANVTVVDRKKCSKHFRSTAITKEMLCAGSEKTDACQVRCARQVSNLSQLPQLCSCEPTCISVDCRETQEGPSYAKEHWSGSRPLV